jgi:hypothetical protein
MAHPLAWHIGNDINGDVLLPWQLLPQEALASLAVLEHLAKKVCLSAKGSCLMTRQPARMHAGQSGTCYARQAQEHKHGQVKPVLTASVAEVGSFE